VAKGGMNIFLLSYYSSLVKGAMNAARLCKLRNGVKKNASISSLFNGKKWTKCAVNISAAI
jgi:hypothetical protein